MKTNVMTFDQLFGNNDDSLESIIAVYKNKINAELMNYFREGEVKNFTEIYFNEDEWTGKIYVKDTKREVYFSLHSSSLIDLKDQIVNRFKTEFNGQSRSYLE